MLSRGNWFNFLSQEAYTEIPCFTDHRSAAKDSELSFIRVYKELISKGPVANSTLKCHMTMTSQWF